MKKRIDHIGSNEAELVYNTALTTKQNIVVSGIVGTGKTALMATILDDSSKKGIMLNGDFTHHSINVYTYFDILWWCYFHDDDAIERIIHAYKGDRLKEIRELDFVILDDVFGIALPTIVAIEKIMRKVRRNKMPFGGVQMIYCGDWNNAGMNKAYRYENRDKDFFFDSFAFIKNDHLFVELKQNYVYHDLDYVQILRSVRCGETTHLPLINKTCFLNKKAANDAVRISYHDDLYRRHGTIGLKENLLIDNDCFRDKGQLYQVLRKAKSLAQISLSRAVTEVDVILNPSLKEFLRNFPKR